MLTLKKMLKIAKHVSQCAIFHPMHQCILRYGPPCLATCARRFCRENKQMFLGLIDSHSKWIEVFSMTSTTSTKKIECLRSCFSSNVIPEQLVFDNEPQFTSSELKQFVTTNGIEHSLVTAYHPSSNGAAEISVHIVKRRIEKVCDGVHGSLNQRLSNFMFIIKSNQVYLNTTFLKKMTQGCLQDT